MNAAAELITRAKRWLHNGYPPVPILRHDAPVSIERKGKRVKQTPGKQPHGALWANKETAVYGATPAKLQGWKRFLDIGDYPGLGFACGDVAVADADVQEPGLAKEIECLVVDHLGSTRLRRVGQVPKVALVYRAAGAPINKVMTNAFFKGGLKAQLEVMGHGQQVVGYGTHPCGVAYTWGNASPDDTPLDDLPAVTQEQVAALVAAAEVRIRAAGYKTKAELKAEQKAEAAPPPKQKLDCTAKTADPIANPFREVNDAALAAPDRWVPDLFGKDAYCDNRGVWRVSSDALGRDREEDISISPAGIVDFGEHDMGDQSRGRRTAIDLVIEHGNPPDAKAAAKWLAAKLGIEVEFRGKKARKAEAGPDGEDANWFDDLLTNRYGEPRDNIANIALALRAEPALVGRLRLDELSQAAFARDMPWRRGTDWKPWTDGDDIALAEYLQLLGIPVKRTTVADAMALVAGERRHHPVLAYLDGLAWDGVKRLDGWLTAYLGVKDGTYTRAVGKAFLVAAVARIKQPGCKADHVLIMEGPQGIGKSQAAAALSPEPDWFTDEIADLGTKDAAQGLRGKWLIELPELSAMRRGEIETVKAFVTRSTDHYRPSYGRRAEDFPRQCVFIGSTNADAYLADDTGNRRFWPIRVGKIDLVKLRQDRAQLWAEALAAFKQGNAWWLDAATEALAKAQQAERQPEDPWTGEVLKWAELNAVFVIETFMEAKGDGLGIAREDIGTPEFRRVASILRREGWERQEQRRIEGKRRRPYEKPSPTSPIIEPMGDAMGDTNKPKSGNGSSHLSPMSPITHAIEHGNGSRLNKPDYTQPVHKIRNIANKGDMGDMGDTLIEETVQ